jgi:uncharacterized protein (DUF2062 family)
MARPGDLGVSFLFAGGEGMPSDEGPARGAGESGAPAAADAVRPCVLIPVYNHAATLMDVVRAARRHVPVLVVDDGSTDGADALLAAEPGIAFLRLPRNEGKGAALRAGFARAAEMGYTHAITMDADGQHLADDLPAFAEACRRDPAVFWVGIRDLKGSGAPRVRRFTNAFSNFWFWVETGLAFSDTQCGFRCYPLAMTRHLAVRSGRYAYELEMLVRAAWSDVPLRPVPVRVDYLRPQSQRSHFHPAADFLRISLLNTRLVIQAFFLPRLVRALQSRRELEGQPFGRRARMLARLVFTENADTPGRLAGSVGLGLFCGIAPIWGFQMMTAAVLAHAARLNKAIAMAASNISVPVLIPFILFASFCLGHLLFTGETLAFTREELARVTSWSVLKALGEYVAGSLALAAGVSAAGAGLTYGIAALVHARRRAAARNP